VCYRVADCNQESAVLGRVADGEQTLLIHAVLVRKTMRGLRQKINRVWAKLKTGKKSTTKRSAEAQHRCEKVQRELLDADGSSEDIQR
jgi:hypothetical protein